MFTKKQKTVEAITANLNTMANELIGHAEAQDAAVATKMADVERLKGEAKEQHDEARRARDVALRIRNLLGA